MAKIESIQINVSFANNAERVTIATQLSVKKIEYQVLKISSKSMSIIVSNENDLKIVSDILKKLGK